MTTTLPFARTIDLDPVPAGKHLVGFADEQRAAREQEEIPTWQPTPPLSKPASVLALDEQADAEEKAAAESTARAQQARAAAEQRGHDIRRAEEAVKSLEREVAELAGYDPAAEIELCRAALLVSPGRWNQADPTRMVDVWTNRHYRAVTFAKDVAAKLKQKQSELESARKHLAELAESK